MPQPEIEQQADSVISAIKAAIVSALGPIRERLKALEARAAVPGPKGDPGEIGPIGPEGAKGIDGVAGPAGEPGPKGDPGERGEKGIDGAIGPQGERGPEGPAGRDGRDGVDGKDGRDGKDANVEALKAQILADLIPEIATLVASQVTKAIGAMPVPTNGKDGRDGMDADPELIRAEVAKAVAAIPVPKDGDAGKDGIGLAGAMIDKDGALVVTLSDGTMKTLGAVVGRDGAKGEPGERGPSGRDGTLEGLKATRIDERTIALCFADGTPIEGGTFKFETVLYRGVYQAGKQYEAGDATTWAGSLWIATEVTDAKPGAGSTPWRLAVKAGRDGRNGDKGEKGATGPQGPQGPAGGLNQWKP